MNPVPLRVTFFDLGETLVTRIPGSPSGQRFDWISGARDLLTRLRSLGLKLGLISNTGVLDRVQLLQMLPSDFDFDLFEEDLVVLSSETEYEKPDPRIFRLAVSHAQSLDGNKMEIDTRECLFVGENLVEVLSAQGIGMVGARVRQEPKSDIGTLDDDLKKCGLIDARS